MELNKEKEGRRRTLTNTDEHQQNLMTDLCQRKKDLLMLLGQRSGATVIWSIQGDAAAGVEVGDGGRRR